MTHDYSHTCMWCYMCVLVCMCVCLPLFYIVDVLRVIVLHCERVESESE